MIQPALRTMIAVAAGVSLIGTVGCSTDSSTNTEEPTTPQLGEVSLQNAITVWAQAIGAVDGGGEVFPGAANFWDLNPRMAIQDGSHDQFDNGMSLSVDGTPFPNDQTYAGLTAYTPELGTGDGLSIAAADDGTTSGFTPITGTYSALIAPTQNSRLFQTLDLRLAAIPVVLTYAAIPMPVASYFADEDYYFQVVVRNTSNGIEETLYRMDQTGVTGTLGVANLDAYVGNFYRVSFETNMGARGYVQIDDVSVIDDNAVEYIANGGFESGSINGWSRNTPAFVRNLTSTSKSLANLDVTRSFFSTPSSMWGRFVDVFTNNTGAQIDATVSYSTDLGSDGKGIIYDSVNANMMAVTTWDGEGLDRDVGLVFGTATTVDYLSDDGLNNGNGNQFITLTYDISVPAGQSVAIATYVILSGTNTGQTATAITDTADEIDTEAARIVAGYPTTNEVDEFTNGMTQAQIDNVINF